MKIVRNSAGRNPQQRRLRWIATAALALLPMLTNSAIDPKAGRFYEDALRLYEKKDLAGAVLQLKNALQIDKNVLPVHLLLGKVSLDNGDVAAAEVAFTEALRLGVSRSEVVLPLARSLVGQGKHREIIDSPRFQLAGLLPDVQSQLLLLKAAALADLGDARPALQAIQDARALTPLSIDVWLAEVPIRIRAREFKEAMQAADKARSINAGSPALNYQVGSILHVSGDRPGALTAYSKTLVSDPNHVEARVARVGLLVDSGRLEEAAKDATVLLEKTPNEPRGWYLNALLAERAGKTRLVKDSLRRITSLLDPVPLDYIRYRPQLLLLNGQAHFGLDEVEKAKPLFEAFNKVQPASPVTKLLANMYLAEGNQDRAIDMLEQYLRSFPNDAQAMALLASAHMAKGRHARAASLMQEALRSKDAPELQSAYGLSLLGMGQSANALAQLEAAYRKDPGLSQAGVALVGLYLRNNQRPKALVVAQDLVARQPEHPGLLELLGQAKAMNNDIAGARAAFERAILLDPKLDAAMLSLVRLETANKHFDRSATLLDGLLQSNARNADAMYEQAELAERRGQSDNALRWLQKAYDVAGAKDLRISLALVDRHMRQGRPAEALKLMRQVAATAPDQLKVLLAMARVQLANADMPSARATLTTAARVAGYDASSLVEIALLQLLARDLPAAAYSTDKALSAKPDLLPARVLMTEIATRQGDFAKAEQLAHGVLKAAPKLAIGHSLMGDLALARKQPGPAVEAYRKAHQAQPSTETLMRLFHTTSIEDPKAAVTLGELWLKSHPDDFASRKMLATAHVRSNNMTAARREYDRLRQLAPRDADVLNNLANVLLRLNEPQALAVAEEALAVDPNNAAAIDTAGWVAFNMGKLDRALQLLRDARLRHPESAETRYHLAAALVKSGRAAEAREELEAALRNSSEFDGRGAAEAMLRTLK